jgi:hypothetical protein
MLKKAIAVGICIIAAVICFAACESGVSDEELHREVIGVWVPTFYDLTTNDPFIAIMITEDKHYLYDFSGGEIGARGSIMEEGTKYEIKDGYFVVNTIPFEEGDVSEQLKAKITFPDRNNMLWGSGPAIEKYRRMTDDEIAYFGLNLGWYNKDYLIDETNLTVPMTGGDTTTGGSGTINFEGAFESSIGPYLEFYATYKIDQNPVTSEGGTVTEIQYESTETTPVN